MESDTTADSRERVARILLAAVLALVAVASLRKKQPLLGLVAGLGAVGLGYSVVGTSESDGPAAVAPSEPETGVVDAGMSCAACGDPIVAGESRRPDRENRIVHESCL